MRSAIMEIDINAFKHNMKEIQNYVGNNVELMPVIKANAYGTYINLKLELIKPYNIVAVAIADEAINIRNIGFTGDILILNQPCVDDLNEIYEYDISVGLSDIEFLDQIILNKKSIKIHLELETGMGRTGIKIEDLENICIKIKNNPFIEVQGIYTHFSVADTDKSYTKMQIEKFDFGVNIAKKYFENIKYIHNSASNGILNFHDEKCNTVRPGIIMYGYESFERCI